MAAAAQNDDEMITSINVTPLVDITLVLLIILMITASYVASTGKLKIFKNAAGAGQFTEAVSGDLTSSMKVRCDTAGTALL